MDDCRVAMFTLFGADEKLGFSELFDISFGFGADDGADPCKPHSICRRFDLYRRFWDGKWDRLENRKLFPITLRSNQFMTHLKPDFNLCGRKI